MTTQAAAPSRELDHATWEEAHGRLINTLRELIRIRSINPVQPEAPDGELIAARHIAELLRDAGLAPNIVDLNHWN